ncbi:MAG TPA: hypothetical protein VN444_05455 [Verrucomicrobiae bacterium]|nr:hypothetical protein [Verrucomicrobiae bacterium]
MKVFNLFSKRQKRGRGEVPDVYQYKTIPDVLRVQVVHIMRDAFGELDRYNDGARNAYKFIHETLCREYGVFTLGGRHNSDFESVVDFLLQTQETEKAIDVIELSFRFLDRVVRENAYQYEGGKISPDDAIAELNYRFREHGVGYQYESGTIIRVDSQLIHSEVVRPVLSMLSDPMYEGANAEFLSAHEHYRTRKYKECLNDCLKAFESCIKTICAKRGWAYSASDTAKRLVEIVFERELIPTFMQSHFSALRSTLEAGVPTVRNRLSGHGQGSEEVSVPESIAAYALHLTASNILLLARADDEMK